MAIEVAAAKQTIILVASSGAFFVNLIDQDPIVSLI